ncbi:hypothetical protein ACH5RR_016505 [Cinchona calisaya]|uniref:SnoaL-like domain-containing protein n=1 Tax=Cinchona calisaya TaxID=153742 RepID=A0ABD2ZW57_9GENT
MKKSSTTLMRLNRVTLIMQMDKLLPRSSLHSLKTFSTTPLHPHPKPLPPLLDPSSFTSFACFADHQLLQLHSSLKKYSYSISTSEPTMEKNSKDNEEEIKDQSREGYGKGACDYDPSNRAFDDILPHILNIYASRATPQDFEIYAPDATFEDPLMRSQGIKQIKSAFYSIPKVFSESRIVEYSIKEQVISPGKKEILMDNKQYYKFLGKDINMISLIRLHLENGKIVRHEDWWDKKPLWNRETVQLPLLGRITEMTRRASMLATHALMGFGKDPKA